MKKIYWFHLGMIAFLFTLFCINHQGPECELQIINYIFLTMLTVAYIIASIVTAIKE